MRVKSLVVLLLGNSCQAFLHPRSVTLVGGGRLSAKTNQKFPTTMAASRLVSDQSLFFCCDIQERFRTLILRMPHVVHTAHAMTQASRILDIPVVVTEQNPRALLPTVSELDISNAFKVDKTHFSMMVPQVVDFIRKVPSRQSVVLFGIEAHVCIQQTTLDLLEDGYSVHLVCDGISSQRSLDRSTALLRLQQAGAHLTTSESVLFELMRDSTHPQFKAISALMKHPRPAEALPCNL
eukprot:GHVS01061981.1.p1 GENE.GHVS01061981.1~~GHVS01061981.1.p1  ORF type:complete len:237 (+),score=17.82 GHVS01061981.1:168-878(+)